jgi:hypothetical protein
MAGDDYRGRSHFERVDSITSIEPKTSTTTSTSNAVAGSRMSSIEAARHSKKNRFAGLRPIEDSVEKSQLSLTSSSPSFDSSSSTSSGKVDRQNSEIVVRKRTKMVPTTTTAVDVDQIGNVMPLDPLTAVSQSPPSAAESRTSRTMTTITTLTTPVVISMPSSFISPSSRRSTARTHHAVVDNPKSFENSRLKSYSNILGAETTTIRSAIVKFTTEQRVANGAPEGGRSNAIAPNDHSASQMMNRSAKLPATVKLSDVHSGLATSKSPSNVDVGRAFSLPVTCASDSFACPSSGDKRAIESCVPVKNVCDGTFNCPDGADEKFCGNRSRSVEQACAVGYFRCDSGLAVGGRRCLPEIDRCDRVRDCLDASDELNCTYKCTEPEYFRCERGAVSRWPYSGFCLRPNERCNGVRECRDGSDERGCGTSVLPTSPSSSSPTTVQHHGVEKTAAAAAAAASRCGADEWSCADAAACLPLAFRCDRRRHCADGSDETNCDFRCPSGSFPCRTGTLAPSHGVGFCVAARAACDGVMHCADGSDEDDCNSTCADGYFRCRAGAHVINRQPCVPIEYVCDREQDCADGSDEPPTCNVTCPENQVSPLYAKQKNVLRFL